MKGAKAHSDRLKRLAGIRPQVRAIVLAAADELAAEAAISITTGAVSGKNHKPSKPGEPPKNDTGVLARSIKAIPGDPADGDGIEGISARVIADAPYARALEWGTSKMAERPFMRPATAKVRPHMHRNIDKAVEAVLRGATINGSKK